VTSPGVACIVLGAGAGARFGAPKAGAELRPGVRFIDAVVATAAAAGADPIVAVLPAGFAPPVPARAVVNDRPQSEQIHSVRLGLAQLVSVSVSGALLWPVDHPYVTVESVLAVLDAARRTGAPIVIPAYAERRGHPAFFARDSWRELMTVPAGGARAVVRGYGGRVAHVAVPDEGVVRDVDTRDDLRGE
jgi:molybdenum cofactor cytidylyltransferase